MTTKTKPTLATLKSFIKREFKNKNLFIKQESSFDGMVDCVMPIDGTYNYITSLNLEKKHDFGIRGAWLVGNSNDYITTYADKSYIGYEVSNSCGNFIIAMKRLY